VLTCSLGACSNTALCLRGRSTTRYAHGTRDVNGQELLASVDVVLRESTIRAASYDDTPDPLGERTRMTGTPCRVAMLCAWQLAEEQAALSLLSLGLSPSSAEASSQGFL
jgi:hypothetical protein